MFRLSLPVPAPVKSDPGSSEIARIWFTAERRLAVRMNVAPLDDPAMFGIALSDVINQFCDMQGRDPEFRQQLLMAIEKLAEEMSK